MILEFCVPTKGSSSASELQEAWSPRPPLGASWGPSGARKVLDAWGLRGQRILYL